MTGGQLIAQILGAIGILLIGFLVAAFVVAIVQVLRSTRWTDREKSLWIIGLFVLPVPGMMAWYALGRRG